MDSAVQYLFLIILIIVYSAQTIFIKQYNSKTNEPNVFSFALAGSATALLIYRERLSKTQLIGYGIGLVSVILLNL